MLNDVSLLVYTSRARAIHDSVDKTVVFKEREVHGEISRSMLISHANIGSYEDLSAAKREVVKGILDICQGLPLAFGIAGGTARRYFEDGVNKQNAWSEYYHDLTVDLECIATGSTTQYGSVLPVAARSLKVLDSGPDMRRKFTEKFKALCVIMKQQSVSGQMLQKLWSLEIVQHARKVAETLDRVSLIRLVRVRENQFSIRVHDLILDIATQMNSESERIGWFRTLADNYASKVHSGSCEGEIDLRAEEKHVATPWWSAADDGFVHDNLCRILKGAGKHRELLWLLKRAQWIVMRLQTGGLAKVEQELDLGMSVAESCARDEIEEVKYLELVKSAVRASWFAIDEVWFQLYGRLAWYSGRCERTRSFLAEIEEHAPRPWVKASVGVLPQAGGIHSGSVRVAAEHGGVICLCGVGGVIQIVQKKGIVTEYDTKRGMEKKHKLSESGEMRSGAFSEDGKRLVTLDCGGEVVLWNCACGYHVEKHVTCSDDIECVRISGNGQTVAYGSEEYLW